MAPGAMMATSGTAFTSARPVQSAPVPVTHEMQTSAAVGMTPGVAPTRASLGVAPEGATLRTPPAALESRPVVANVAPPPAPVPFAAKQQALAANGGRPLAPAQEQQIRQSSPSLASTSSAMYRPAAVAPAGGGLKPAHAGLAAATPVSGAAAQGYVPRTVAASRSVTTLPCTCGGGEWGGGVERDAAAQHGAASAGPGCGGPVATRVPSSTGNQNSAPGASTSSGGRRGTVAPTAMPRVMGRPSRRRSRTRRRNHRRRSRGTTEG